MLRSLTEKWLVLESKHRTSKSASEDFWQLSKHFFPLLARARIDQMVYKPIPKLRSQRKKIKKENVPKITLKIGYVDKETDEIFIVKDEKTPIKRFGPGQYKKLFEVATVQVIIYETFTSFSFSFSDIP